MRNATIVGERLYLRPLEAEDAEPIARAFASETETFFDRGRLPASPLGFAHAITAPAPGHGPPEVVDFAVCRRADDRLVGSVAILDLDWVNRTGETASHLLGPEFRGQGYGTEAKHLLLEYAFDRLGLHALTSWVWEPNARSAAALAKQGYRPAGRVRWRDIKGGVYRDSLIFDVLRADWVAARDAWRAATAAASVPR
ncbi:MAG: hypothetical protein AVDCRST_MAG49-2869 [uncultured Thermomicrobiales bacterium]|uniref:N-acetyltransferase domain-containing protein n=1 Tax=uncultured Thermomicrobiales bacterium TaxID=1645740 RepID=A0A6J4UR40_9BACT|nr:MAG: hypothetical protein AVDCRST_MAG49-2869 [uncultured Thermomicrobiales bacterium]